MFQYEWTKSRLRVASRLLSTVAIALLAGAAIPTLLDGLSIAGVPQLLKQVYRLKTDLDLKIEFAGVIGTMTLHDEPTDKDKGHIEAATAKVLEAWPGLDCDGNPSVVIPRTIPRRVAFSDAAGNNVAILTTAPPELKEIMNNLFKEMCHRIDLI